MYVFDNVCNMIFLYAITSLFAMQPHREAQSLYQGCRTIGFIPGQPVYVQFDCTLELDLIFTDHVMERKGKEKRREIVEEN